MKTNGTPSAEALALALESRHPAAAFHIVTLWAFTRATYRGPVILDLTLWLDNGARHAATYTYTHIGAIADATAALVTRARNPVTA